MHSSGVGLREIKKQLTRESIANAALELTLEKGFENVTIEEVARRAFVSPRTFSNYFAHKEEAVIVAGGQYWSEVVNRLPERPEQEHPLQAIRALLVDATNATTDESLARATEVMRLVGRYAQLRPYLVDQYTELEGRLRSAIAIRSGTDLSADLHPWLVAAAAVAAIKTAMGLWLLSDAPTAALPELIEDAFEQIAHGLPAPQTRTADPVVTSAPGGGHP